MRADAVDAVISHTPRFGASFHFIGMLQLVHMSDRCMIRPEMLFSRFSATDTHGSYNFKSVI